MECYAYCTTASFQMKPLFQHFRGQHKAERYKDVLHLSILENEKETNYFIFPYGAIVTWGATSEEAGKILSEIKPFENGSYDEVEMECYEYRLKNELTFRDDVISLTDDDPLTKLAFSQGIAQSVRLCAIEMSIQNTFEKTKHLPEYLAKHGSIPLSRRSMRKKIGTLFLERSAINLHMDVLNTPDFFWEYPQYEKIYGITQYELDLDDRTSTLNQQLNVLHEMFEMLGNELNHQHSSRLEWAIIILIVIEVAMILFHDILKLI